MTGIPKPTLTHMDLSDVSPYVIIFVSIISGFIVYQFPIFNLNSGDEKYTIKDALNYKYHYKSKAMSSMASGVPLDSILNINSFLNSDSLSMANRKLYESGLDPAFSYYKKDVDSTFIPGIDTIKGRMKFIDNMNSFEYADKIISIDNEIEGGLEAIEPPTKLAEKRLSRLSTDLIDERLDEKRSEDLKVLKVEVENNEEDISQIRGRIGIIMPLLVTTLVGVVSMLVSIILHDD